MQKKKYVFSTNKLRARMIELGMQQFEVAEKLKISKTSLSAKLNGKSHFTPDEIYDLVDILCIADNYKEYFFTLKV